MNNIIVYIPPILALISLLISLFFASKRDKMEDKFIELLTEELKDSDIKLEKIKIILNSDELIIKGNTSGSEDDVETIYKKLDEIINLSLEKLERNERQQIRESILRSYTNMGHNSYKENLLIKAVDKLA